MAKLLLGSVVGPQGPQGTPGVKGSQGPQGVPGPNEIAATTNVVGLTSGQLLYNKSGKVGSVNIVDNLLSIDPYKPLSANQGKVLKGLIDDNGSAIGQKANITDVNNSLALKADMTYVDTQISAVAGGSPKGTYATLVDLQTAYPTGTTGIFVVIADGNWYYWSGSVWTSGGTYQSTGIADGSVTKEKVDFLELGRNLYDPLSATTGRYINYTNGVPTTGAGYAHTDYIPVTAGSYYTITPKDTVMASTKFYPQQLAFYDASKVYISGKVKAKTIQAPATAAYMRVSMFVEYINGLMIEVGETPTPFTEYGKKLNTDNLIKGVYADMPSKNMFNKGLVIADKYVRYTDGVLVTNASYYTSDCIKVAPSTTYRKTSNEQFAFFDINLAYVGGSANGYTFTTPANAYFVQLALAKTSLDTLMLSETDTIMPYEDYGYKIPSTFFQANADNPQVRYVSPTGKYKTVTEAVTSLVTDVNNRGIVYIMPGKYKESVRIKFKYIDLIGLNPESCIIYNTTNDYINPPIDMSSDHNTIQNLTVISDFDENTNLVENHLFAYAVHIDNALDSSGGKSAIRNCILKSNINREALGMGTWNGSEIVVEDSVIESVGTHAMYAHNMQSTGANQKIKFKNVEFITHADKEAIYVNDANYNGGTADSQDTEISFVNCAAYSKVRGITNVVKVNTPLDANSFSGYIKLTGTSHGNNIPALNNYTN